MTSSLKEKEIGVIEELLEFPEDQQDLIRQSRLPVQAQELLGTQRAGSSIQIRSPQETSYLKVEV